MIIEGRKAVYTGDDLSFEHGASCTVLALSGLAAHVQWLDGPRTGSVDLVDTASLSQGVLAPSMATQISEEFDASLDVEASTTTSAREAYDAYGEDGLLAALNEAGHLATLTPYVEDALGGLTASLRHDPGLSVALGFLDDDERETVLSAVARTLLIESEAS